VIEDELRKAIDRVAVLRCVVKSRPGQHLVQAARGARVVREKLRFAARQLGPSRATGSRPRGAAGYRLRDSGVQIFLRHNTLDVLVLKEIFGGLGGRYAYEPPPTLAAALDANPRLKVLDLGANIGLFGAYVLGRWPGAAIQSFEPDPANLRLLVRAIAANELEDRWLVTDVAVANYTGEMTFVAGLFSESHLATMTDQRTAEDLGVASDQSGVDDGSTAREDGRTITVRTVDVFDQDHDVDLMKIDIEGGEWSILADTRMASLKADVLVLEWHRRGCPEPDARGTAARLLRAAGYSRQEEVVGRLGDVLWAWREKPPAFASCGDEGGGFRER